MPYSNEKFDVLVVGAGVIGAATAYELAKSGARVAVIDKGEPGFGCSYGNAGWITPCFSMPLPMPGMLLKSVGWMLDPESPLYIKPEPSLLLLRWLTRFLLCMRKSKMLESVNALTEISKFSLGEYERLTREEKMDFSFEKRGLLMVTQTQDGLDYAVKEMTLVAQNGVPGRQMSGDEIRAFEPAITGGTVGGVFFPEEAQAEPLAVVRALVQGATSKGAQFFSGAELIDFRIEGTQVRSVRTTRGIFHADQVVLATGSWSHPIAKQLRLNIPVLGGKGYAIISKPLTPNPSRPLMLVEKKVAITPRRDTLRLAGTLELVNGDLSITPQRVDTIVRGAREFLNVPAEIQYSEIWRGLRPCTPDGVPIIGYPRRYTNLLVVTGHQMLGLQSAPGSARLAADLLFKRTPAFDPYPFRATRF